MSGWSYDETPYSGNEGRDDVGYSGPTASEGPGPYWGQASDVPQLTATAAYRVYSQCGAGGYLYYLYTDTESSSYIGCLHNEVPVAGRTYRTTDRKRRTVDVTVAGGFHRANF
jgi:hypothetical protein